MTRLAGPRFVEDAKVRGYLLNEAHEDGGPKARFFISFGFSVADPDSLLNALWAHPERNELVKSEATRFGIKSVVECSVVTPDGRNPCIRSVWIKYPGTDVQRLVTAYPDARLE